MADKEQAKKAKALLVFQALDADGSNTLTHDELGTLVDESDLPELLSQLDPKGTGEITFGDFYAGFQHYGDDDDDDEDGCKVLGAEIKMDVVKAAHDERAKGFEAGLGDDDEEEHDDQSTARTARFKKIVTWMNSEPQRVSSQELLTTFKFLLREEFADDAKNRLENILVQAGSHTVSSQVVGKSLEKSFNECEKQGQWDNSAFSTVFLDEFEKLVQAGKGVPAKGSSLEEQVASLSQRNRSQEQKVAKLQGQLAKINAMARRLDDENAELRDRLGDGAKGKKSLEEIEKEHADSLKSFGDMIEQLQNDKIALEKKMTSLQREHSSDKALLKIKQKIENQRKAELKDMQARMKGVLNTHSEQNKLELKKKVGKMTAIIARRRFIRELQVDNERIPGLEVENNRLKDTVSKLQEEAKEYMRVMDSYREKDRGEGTTFTIPKDNPGGQGIAFGDEEELEELRKRLQEEMDASKKTNEKLDDTLNLLEEEKQGREAAEEKVKSLTTQVEELTAQVTEMTTKISQLEEELESEKKGRSEDAERYESEISELKSKVEDVSKQLEEETAARTALEEQLGALGDDSQSKIADLTQEVAGLKKQVKELESDADSGRTKKEALEQELEATKAELENEQQLRKQLEEELDQKTKDLTEAQAKLQEFEDMFGQMEREVVTIIEAKVFVEAKEKVVDVNIALNPDQQAELSAYARCFNKKLKDEPNVEGLLPISENTGELLFKLKDGILIAKFINQCVPDTIDERALNMDRLDSELMLENLTLCIGSAKAIGIPIRDEQKLQEQLLSPTDPDLLLDFLFQLVKTKYFTPISVRKRPELLEICENPQTGLSGLKLKEIETDTLQGLDPQDLLLRWLNWHRISEADDRLEALAKDWGEDLCDATAYSSILGRIAECKGRASEMPDTAKTDGKRARHVIDKANVFEIDHFHLPNNITGGNPRLNMLFAACIFGHHTGIGDEDDFDDASSGRAKRDQSGQEMDELSEEDREERAYRMWINSMAIPGCFVNNLFLDCRDGLKILKLIDFIRPNTVDWKRIEKKPKGKFKKVSNCNYIIKYCKKPLNLKLKLIGGTDIVDGNPKLILAIMGQLMRYDTMLKLEKAFKKIGLAGGAKEEDAILDWANGKVAEKKHAKNPTKKIRSFKDKNISDSLFFFNLLWVIQPKLIKWKMVNTDATSKADKTRNAGYVISVTRKLGADVYLLPHDIVEVKPKQIMLFIGSIMSVAS